MEKIVSSFKSLFEVSSERLKNPFIYSFIVSVLLINWKSLLIILTSNNPIEDTLIYIETFYLSTSKSLLVPFGIALIYAFGLDYFMWGIEFLTYKGVDGRRNMKNEHLISKIKRKYGRDEISLRYEAQKSALLREQDVNLQIENLKSEVKNLSEETKQLREKEKDYKNEINELKAEYRSLIDREDFNYNKFYGELEINNVISQKRKLDISKIEEALVRFMNDHSSGKFHIHERVRGCKINSV